MTANEEPMRAGEGQRWATTEVVVLIKPSSGKGGMGREGLG